jgi:hypothetical protein
MALGQTVVLNTLVNRLDVWARDKDWARVGTRVWARNIRYGWAWDEDAFPTNVFAHPYHGGLYFNAGRENGLDFFESVPVTLFGAFTWEYFAETERPSLNDFLMSTVGGVAIGEMFYRISATIRDNEATGARRTWRELATLPFDPVGAANRLFRGQWKTVASNPAEHTPDAYVLRVGAGARYARELVDGQASRMGALVVDLLSGDQFAAPYHKPFDVFNVRLIVSSYGGLNALRAAGRLYGHDLNDSTARFRHVLAVNQRYDYVKNPAQSIGGQSVEVGINSRLRLGSRGFGVRTSLFVDGIILGAIDAPGTGVGLRDYDFGPGAGFRWEAALDRHGARFFVLHGRVEYIHTVSGASADHVVNFSGVEVTLPLGKHFGIAGQTTIFNRASHYSDRPRDRRDYPEGRLMVVWTQATSRP